MLKEITSGTIELNLRNIELESIALLKAVETKHFFNILMFRQLKSTKSYMKSSEMQFNVKNEIYS